MGTDSDEKIHGRSRFQNFARWQTLLYSHDEVYRAFQSWTKNLWTLACTNSNQQQCLVMNDPWWFGLPHYHKKEDARASMKYQLLVQSWAFRLLLFLVTMNVTKYWQRQQSDSIRPIDFWNMIRNMFFFQNHSSMQMTWCVLGRNYFWCFSVFFCDIHEDKPLIRNIAYLNF